jgi:hypothetical protein
VWRQRKKGVCWWSMFSSNNYGMSSPAILLRIHVSLELASLLELENLSKKHVEITAYQ